MKIINYNNELINIIFVFMTGTKYPIKCSPNITIDEMISYFMEAFCVKLTLKEFKEKVFFIYSAENLNNHGSEKLKEMKINNGAIIMVSDQNNVINYNLIRMKQESDEQNNNKKEKKNLRRPAQYVPVDLNFLVRSAKKKEEDALVNLSLEERNKNEYQEEAEQSFVTYIENIEEDNQNKEEEKKLKENLFDNKFKAKQNSEKKAKKNK